MKQLWFKEKRFGWGWYPATWQGWSVLFLYFFFIGGAFFYFDPRKDQSMGEAASFLVAVLVATIVLLVVCYKTGETPHWNWPWRDSYED